MKITLISILTPAKENIRGTSALPYHLLAGRRNDMEVEIYSFNSNSLSREQIEKVEEELNVTVHVMPLPKWFTFVFKWHLLFLRLFLRYPIHHYISVTKKWEERIKSKKPDLIWVYGAELSKIDRQFEGHKRIHTLPDSEALYYYRMLSRRFVVNDWKKFWRCAFMYPKFLALEKNYVVSPDVCYHLVGEADVEFLRSINPDVNAKFIRHPHYEVKNNFNDNDNENEGHEFKLPLPPLILAGELGKELTLTGNFNHDENENEGHEFKLPLPPLILAGESGEELTLTGNFNYDDNENENQNEDHEFKRPLPPLILAGESGKELTLTGNFNFNGKFRASFSSPKIKLLVAGLYNYYMKQDADLLVEALKKSADDLHDYYALTFLGKGWEGHAGMLRKAGYDVAHISFAPDYIEEVCKHDVQLTPISIGTGTKGKVLDALANGLLVVGTPYAMENIAVENGVSCVEYHKAEEAIAVLKDIPGNRRKYEVMAERGRKAVLTLHDRKRIAAEVFGLLGSP